MSLFPTIEVGSLPKMPGRQARLQGREVNESDTKMLHDVSKLAGSPPELEILIEELKHANGPEEIVRINSRFNLQLLESIGITQVFDGEAHRREMYEGVVAHVQGMQRLDKQVSFVNRDGLPNTFVPFSYVAPLSIAAALHLDETRYIMAEAKNQVKVPVTGAYTLGTWSDLGPFPSELMKKGQTNSAARKQVMQDLVYQFADQVINPTLKALAQTGVERIQIDEPNASAFYQQAEVLYEATRRSVQGVSGVKLGMHICFSTDYSSIAEIAAIPEISFITLEIANRDTANHDAYTQVINAFEKAGYQGQYCVGVLDVHTDVMELAEVVRDRLLHVATMVGPERIEAAPDCGLRSRILPVAVQKLKVLVEGAQLAERKYSG